MSKPVNDIKINAFIKLKQFWELNNEKQLRLTNTLSYKQWVKYNRLRWAIWLVPTLAIGIGISVAISFVSVVAVLAYFVWLIPTIVGIMGVLFSIRGNKGWLKYWKLKYAGIYPKEIVAGGSNFFLKDVRFPWKSKSLFYDKMVHIYYHLPEPEWIINANSVDVKNNKEYEYHKKRYLNEIKKIFTFEVEDSIYDAKHLQGLWQLLKDNASINNILSATMSYTDEKVAITEKEFINLVSQMMLEYKYSHPIIYYKSLPKMPNAINTTPSGGGKTTAVVYNQIIANANAYTKGSMLIADPKGEIFQKISGWLRQTGYDVYCLDLKTPEYSQTWNPLTEVYYDILAKGYLEQIFASYQKHNLPEYKQLSEVIYNKSKKYDDFPTVEQQIEKIYNDSEYKPFLFKIYNKYDEKFVKESTGLTCRKCDILFSTCNCYHNDKNHYYNYGKASDNKQVLLAIIGEYVYDFEYLYQHYYLKTLGNNISTKAAQIVDAISQDKDGKEEPFWKINGVNVILTAFYILAEKKMLNVYDKTINEDNFTLISLYKLITSEDIFNMNALGEDVKSDDWNNQKEKAGWLSTLGKSEEDEFLRQYALKLSSADKGKTPLNSSKGTKSSIKTVSTSKLNDITPPAIQSALSANDINLDKIVKSNKPFVLFVILDIDNSIYHKIAILLISYMYNKLTWWASQNPKLQLSRPFMFLLDELGNLPAIPDLAKNLSVSRSYRIMFLIVLQSTQQLQKRYEKDVNTIIENCKYKVIRGADDFQSADTWSKILGDTTIKKDGLPVQYQRVPLMAANEILSLDYAQLHHTLFFAAVFNPNEQNYYSDKKGKKDKNVPKLSAGNYQFIEFQKPWYALYDIKNKFEKIGKYKLFISEFDRNKGIIEFDKAKLHSKPRFDYYKDEKVEQKVVKIQDDYDYIMSNKDSLDDIVIVETKVKDEKTGKVKKVKKGKKVQQSQDIYEKLNENDNVNFEAKEDVAANVALYMEKFHIISSEELTNENEFEYETMKFEVFMKKYLTDDKQNLQYIAIIDRDSNTLEIDIQKLFTNQFTLTSKKTIAELLDDFAQGISIRRFNVLIKNLVEVNNIIIDEDAHIGINRDNAKYVNQISYKIVTWLLFGVNNFDNNSIFDKQINTYILTKPEDRKYSSVHPLYEIKELINIIKKYLKSDNGVLFTEQFIVEYIGNNDLETSWKGYWETNYELKSKWFDKDWLDYINKLLKN